MKKKLPNFIISGFPKCGSTALHYFLNEHPSVYMPKQKELHYFTNHILKSLNRGKGDKEIKKTQIKTIDEYKKCFKGVKDEIAIGDASPSYINYPSEFRFINKQLDNPKIIILIRDPIKRAYSNYLHLVRERRESLSFYEALQKEDIRKEKKYSDFWYYSFNSSYYNKIKAAKQIFKDVLIITQEDLNANTESTLKEVFKFIGVDSDFIPSNINRRYNPGGSYKDNAITNFFFKPSGFKTSIKKTIPIPVWVKHLKHRLIKPYQMDSPKIDEDSKKYLINLFQEDVNKLKTEFGINTDLWSKEFEKLG